MYTLFPKDAIDFRQIFVYIQENDTHKIILLYSPERRIMIMYVFYRFYRIAYRKSKIYLGRCKRKWQIVIIL